MSGIFSGATPLRSRWQIGLMTLILRMLPYMPWKGLIRRRIQHAIERASSAIVLDDYLWQRVERRHRLVPMGGRRSGVGKRAHDPRFSHDARQK